MLFWALLIKAQDNPHGDDLTFDCLDCHTTESWTFSAATAKFDHNETRFKLEGQHVVTDCKACHTSLVFSAAKTSCIDCHTDMHNNTVGMDCARCHDPKSWLVSNITEIHQMSRFPLLGTHNTAACADCHNSASNLEFQPLGVECIDCHRQDYDATTNPNHAQAGLSTDCIECHKIDAFSWSSQGFNHDFFPLRKGHEINDCSACHTSGVFEPISADCYSCHQNDFLTAANPSHQSSGFTTNCSDCHTTNPGWQPAKFDIHDDFYFPVYSGEHRGEWESCADCHTQPESYAIFSCTNCHEHNQGEMDDEHSDINGYSYNSLACYACHPMGRKEEAFNHDNTGFSLKGVHAQTDCLDCHANGFAGTSSECASCHINNYNEAANPVHVTAGISSECQICHTEEGWEPSLFDHVATSGFELTGGHSGKQCADCHIGTTTAASPECITCHQANYNSAPNHLAQNYPTECLQCHTVNSWEAENFDHNLTNFPLTGAHFATECSACHTDGYAGTSMQCNSCHAENYSGAQNPIHSTAGLSTECENCHTTMAWIPSEFDHTVTTGFELTGGHSGRQCADCHIGTTTAASPECITCHQANYNSAPNHLAQNYPTECLQCHTVNSWEAENFDHSLTNFPLTGAHIATECSACHTDGYAGTSMQCNSCHAENYSGAQNPIHSTAGLSTECENCHTTTAWIPSEFDHTVTTGFELTGGHSGRQCADCHIGTTTAASPECITCHQANYNSAPNHLVQNYPTECLQCHTVNSWEAENFDHSLTNFPLTGAHIATECSACHTDGYAGTSMQCNSCHAENYSGAQNPIHTTAGLSTECENCHTTTAWIPSEFDHTATSGFELTGGHAERQCADCHIGTTTAASPECITCHQANYNSAPNHLAQNYPTECLQCHTVNSWEAENFDHSLTNFPLTGAHIATECSACHTDGYAGTSMQCNSCHAENYSGAQNPIHTTAGLSTECENCHTTTAWIPSEFDHTATSGFELTGGHAERQCADCHLGTTTAASPECITCHQANYNSAPNHLAQNYPTECLQCHTVNSWESENFDHSLTNFPLTGAHIATECSACHTDGYAGTSMLCNSCHAENYSQAQNPIHSTAGLSTECENCHTTTAWIPSEFDHTATSGFELTGGHAERQCADCHIGTTTAASPECISCHQANYNSAPNHLAQNYPTECLQCHTVNSWEAENFDHSLTNFPLTGAHIATECSACHTDGYASTSMLCNSCHTDDYNASVNPSHSALGLSASCDECHTTNPGWEPAQFPNHNDYYALNGAHAAVSGNCFLCHKGNYTNTPNTCYECHASDYNTTTDPSHLAANFPTECQTCHTETAWEPSTFDHDGQYFPIYSGRHNGQWNSCADCHTEPTNFAVFSCITCHEHNQTETDSHHNDVSGYAYTATSCFECHPNGFAGDD